MIFDIDNNESVKGQCPSIKDIVGTEVNFDLRRRARSDVAAAIRGDTRAGDLDIMAIRRQPGITLIRRRIVASRIARHEIHKLRIRHINGLRGISHVNGGH